MNRPKPYYDLKAVRAVVLSGQVFLAHRAKNMATLDALGFSDADAFSEIVSLKLTEFKGIAWEKGRAADEYLKRIQGQEIYIKFFMENGLVVLSFHD